MAHKVLLLVAIGGCAGLSYAQQEKAHAMPESVVTGIVLTEEGRPAAIFKVCTQVHFNQSSLDQTQTCCATVTNRDGEFTIEHLKPGTYELLATNDAEGYSIENQTPGQSVTISKNPSLAGVTIRLHNKGPVLLGHITDKTTGKILHDALLEYIGTDCNASGDILRDDGQYYPLPIPANCDVVVIARAEGYSGWVYADAAKPSCPVLRLSAGQRKVLEIQLEPLPEGSAQR